jgi:type IV pilus assembly protein PilA
MSKCKGFTLIELIVVISILGVLMSFVVPSISGVIERSRRSNALNCMKKLADGYLAYRELNGTYIRMDGYPVDSVRDFATLLAQEGLLNDPNCYVFSCDARANSVNKPKNNTIVHADGKTFADCWENTSDINSFSVNIIIDLPDSCRPNTTPIAYTRGLGSGGTWSEAGPFGAKGGFIAFLDGFRINSDIINMLDFKIL